MVRPSLWRHRAYDSESALLLPLAGRVNPSSFWHRSGVLWPNLQAGAQCRPDVWVRLSFLALSSCMVFSGRSDNPNHPLGAGMEVDMLDLNGLLVTSPVSVEGLDQIELKPQQLVGIIAIHADVLLGHVLVALAQKPKSREPGRNDLDRKEGLQLRPALY